MIIFVKQIIAETNGDSEFRKKYRSLQNAALYWYIN